MRSHRSAVEIFSRSHESVAAVQWHCGERHERNRIRNWPDHVGRFEIDDADDLLISSVQLSSLLYIKYSQDKII